MTNVIDRIDPKHPSKEDLGELLEELRKMKQVDVRTVDPSTLVDANEVKVKTDLPPLERTIDYIKQIRNPYCYRVGKVVVKVKFLGERSVNDCIMAAAYGGGTSDPDLPRWRPKGETE